jgi:Tol biopolymer transport system component
VYFCAVRPGGCGGTDLYVLAPGSGNDSITPITELNSPLDDDSPFLSPDGKYLVFNRQTKDPQGKVRHDVMFSYRTPSGQWAPPVNYGRHIGAPGRNWRPVITADGKYLFFGMEGEKGFDVYWVSNRVIEQLKPPQ